MDLRFFFYESEWPVRGMRRERTHGSGGRRRASRTGWGIVPAQCASGPASRIEAGIGDKARSPTQPPQRIHGSARIHANSVRCRV